MTKLFVASVDSAQQWHLYNLITVFFARAKTNLTKTTIFKIAYPCSNLEDAKAFLGLGWKPGAHNL